MPESLCFYQRAAGSRTHLAARATGRGEVEGVLLLLGLRVADHLLCGAQPVRGDAETFRCAEKLLVRSADSSRSLSPGPWFSWLKVVPSRELKAREGTPWVWSHEVRAGPTCDGHKRNPTGVPPQNLIRRQPGSERGSPAMMKKPKLLLLRVAGALAARPWTHYRASKFGLKRA